MKVMDETTWNKILSNVKPVSASIEGLLRSSKPLEFEGNYLKIGVSYKFHKDKLEETKTKTMLEGVFQKVLEKDIRFECLITEQPKVQLTDPKIENIMTVAEEMFS